MYEYIWSFAIATTRFLSNCVKKKTYLSWIWTQNYSPPNISEATLFNILEYICHGRLISIQTRSGEKVSLAPLTLSYVLQGSKKYRKNGAKEIICPSSSCLHSIFVNIWKKLKFVEWFSWCNSLCCLWEEK